MSTPEDLANFTKNIFDIKSNRAKQTESFFKANCMNGNVSMVYGVSTLYAAWQVFFALPPNEPVSADYFPLTNLVVANHLSWLCNSAVAIRLLASQGLEPQAKVLTRSFVEAIYQTLVLFHDRKTYEIYSKAVSNDESKDAYYKLFSKKQNLQKKLQIIENEVMSSQEIDSGNQLRERVEMLESYSQATHASNLHILTSALQPNKDGNFNSTILGGITVSTENTLLNCSHEICYFSALFDHIVKNVWRIQDVSLNSQYDKFLKLASLTAQCRTHNIQNVKTNNKYS